MKGLCAHCMRSTEVSAMSHASGTSPLGCKGLCVCQARQVQARHVKAPEAMPLRLLMRLEWWSISWSVRTSCPAGLQLAGSSSVESLRGVPCDFGCRFVMHAVCGQVHPLIVLMVWGQLVEAHLIPGEALRKADLQEGVRYQTAQPGAYLTARAIPVTPSIALGMYDDRIRCSFLVSTRVMHALLEYLNEVPCDLIDSSLLKAQGRAALHSGYAVRAQVLKNDDVLALVPYPTSANPATVLVPDIMAGRAMMHVVHSVLVPRLLVGPLAPLSPHFWSTHHSHLEASTANP